MAAEALSPVARLVQLVRAGVAEGLSLDDAARRARARAPKLVDDALEDVGAWPSSEPELRAVQGVAS